MREALEIWVKLWRQTVQYSLWSWEGFGREPKVGILLNTKRCIEAYHLGKDLSDHSSQYRPDKVYLVSQKQKCGNGSNGDRGKVQECGMGMLNHDNGHQGQGRGIYAVKKSAGCRRAS
jgi:hypothetical protein